MEISIEGKGNSIRTLVHGVSEFCTLHEKNPRDVAKLIGAKLGASTRYDETNDLFIVSGSWEHFNQEWFEQLIQKS